jgi:quercetin 2,3-dioxygenase
MTEVSSGSVVVLDPREVSLTPRSTTVVRRTIPHRVLRMIGAWCFVDHFGPDAVSDNPMRVAPHPHTGLQTVTWLFDGVVEHRDSVGSVQVIRPGELNIMTAGWGISHSELSVDAPVTHDSALHGVQLWVALPNEHRHQQPHFEHHNELPTIAINGAVIRVLVGSVRAAESPAAHYSPLMAAEVVLPAPGTYSLPLTTGFEHGLLLTDGEARVDGRAVPRGSLAYVEPGREHVVVATELPARIMLLGGEPFDEQIVMWWNFIGRDHDEVVSMRRSWQEADGRFGTFTGYPGDPIPAPAMPGVRLSPRGPVRVHGRAPDEAEPCS